MSWVMRYQPELVGVRFHHRRDAALSLSVGDGDARRNAYRV
jgi:hypothetical protein